MSAPAPQHTTPRCEVVEDCRDYLRTGRCKYGASCKYNHPPNVQSGGGMKTPIDPSEPMFPIRPNEPICQYYMKHGTCKFGQACKFHHPPQVPLHATINGGPVVMNIGRKNDAPQLVLNPVGPDASGASMMLQLLPQRPDEPDCIYFLKNGRCKYGATCRYHHPVNYHQRRAEERRQHASGQDPYHTHKIQYVGQPVGQSTAGYPQGHVILTENPLMCVSIDNNNASQSFQPVSIVTTSDGIPYQAHMGSTVPTEQGSSGSSIASSYDTASSGLEHLTGAGDTASVLWNRPRRNGSGNSLNAFMASDAPLGRAQQSRVAFPHSASDGNIAPRRSRAASFGSATEHQGYFDPKSPSLNRSSSSLGSSWRHERNSNYDHVRRIPGHQFTRQDEIGTVGGLDFRSMNTNHARPPVSGNGQMPRRGPHRRSNRPRETDEGFTMMTSALLTMLDTPEEASAEGYSDDDVANRNFRVDPAMLERLSISDGQTNDNNLQPRIQEDNAEYWSAQWHSSSSTNGQMFDPNSSSLLTPPKPRPTTRNASDSDVGLYLP